MCLYEYLFINFINLYLSLNKNLKYWNENKNFEIVSDYNRPKNYRFRYKFV